MTEQEQFLRGAMERQGSTVYRWPCAGSRAGRTRRMSIRTSFCIC